MPQGTTFLSGRGWPSAEALKGKMWEARCELLSLGQSDGMPVGDSTSKGSHQSEQGQVAFVPLLCVLGASPLSYAMR